MIRKLSVAVFLCACLIVFGQDGPLGKVTKDAPVFKKEKDEGGFLKPNPFNTTFPNKMMPVDTDDPVLPLKKPKKGEVEEVVGSEEEIAAPVEAQKEGVDVTTLELLSDLDEQTQTEAEDHSGTHSVNPPPIEEYQPSEEEEEEPGIHTIEKGEPFRPINLFPETDKASIEELLPEAEKNKTEHNIKIGKVDAPHHVKKSNHGIFNKRVMRTKNQQQQQHAAKPRRSSRRHANRKVEE